MCPGGDFLSRKTLLKPLTIPFSPAIITSVVTDDNKHLGVWLSWEPKQRTHAPPQLNFIKHFLFEYLFSRSVHFWKIMGD